MTDQQPPATPNVAPAPGTALPWRIAPESYGWDHFAAIVAKDALIGNVRLASLSRSHEVSAQDAAYIVHAANAYPALAAENARLIALVESLGEAVAGYDATVKACPANKTFLGDKLCPKCKAGRDEGCRDEIWATMPVIEAARAASKAALPSPPASAEG